MTRQKLTKKQKKQRKRGKQTLAQNHTRLMDQDITVKRLELDATGSELMHSQRKLFREKFGRAPGPDDPVFFDPDADQPRPLATKFPRKLADAARRAGLAEELVYAMQKTGMILVNGVNVHLYSDEDKAAWQAAIDEFRSLH